MPLAPSVDVPSATLVSIVIARLEAQPETLDRIEALFHLRKAFAWLSRPDTITPEERGD